MAAERLHGDDTTAPVLAEGKTDKGSSAAQKLLHSKDAAMTEPAKVIDEFWEICVKVRSDFDLYRSLFEANPRNLELFSSVAPMLFSTSIACWWTTYFSSSARLLTRREVGAGRT
jgi:hypothetical protein